MKFEEIVLNPKEGLSDPLSNIWYHRVKLMNMYKDKGKLPAWPISVEDEQGQIFMRDLIGFLEEEMYESYEHLEHTELVVRKGEILNEDRVKYFLDFNEEVADALHIWFEVLIYFNIELPDFIAYYRKVASDHTLLPENEIIAFKDILQLAINYGFLILNTHEDIKRDNLGRGNMNLHNDGVKYHIETNQLDHEIFEGGKFLSAKTVRTSQFYLFHSVKHLYAARHTLKIKYWRNQEQRPDYEALHNNLMEGWLYFVCFLCLNNFQSSKQIENIYLRKHFINVDRIKKEW